MYGSGDSFWTLYDSGNAFTPNRSNGALELDDRCSIRVFLPCFFFWRFRETVRHMGGTSAPVHSTTPPRSSVYVVVWIYIVGFSRNSHPCGTCGGAVVLKQARASLFWRIVGT